MNCPRCASNLYRKNGRRNGKQNYLCKSCGRQFLEPISLAFDISKENNKILLPDSHLNSPEKTLSETKSKNKDPEKKNQNSLSNKDCRISEPGPFIQDLQLRTAIKTQQPTGISILLLDAENLKLNSHTEKFLALQSQYPLQVKIAFANWRNPSIGRRDFALYERGYQLIHVPEGKDGADAKMIAFGGTMLQYYPTVKEVFVCSSDGILNHLCHQLQSQGLAVYWVRREAQHLLIENRSNGEISYFPLTRATETSSLANLREKIDELISCDSEPLSKRLNNLLLIANLLQETEVNSAPIADNDGIYPEEEELVFSDDQESLCYATHPKFFNSVAKPIKSREELEHILTTIIQEMQITYPSVRLSVAKLGTEFRKLRGQSASSIIKKLNLGTSFTQFLLSSPIFLLKSNSHGYEVGVRA